jgi:hypothetical protein
MPHHFIGKSSYDLMGEWQHVQSAAAMGVVSLEGRKTGQGGVKSDLKSANPA